MNDVEYLTMLIKQVEQNIKSDTDSMKQSIDRVEKFLFHSNGTESLTARHARLEENVKANSEKLNELKNKPISKKGRMAIATAIISGVFSLASTVFKIFI